MTIEKIVFGTKRDSLYPPVSYFDQVLIHCPKAAYLYKIMWQEKNKDHVFEISSLEIPFRTFYNVKGFKDSIRLLFKEGLVNILDESKTFKIELVGWQEENE